LPGEDRDAEDGEIPAAYEVWYPHRTDDVPSAYPSDKERIFYSGYPGLDIAWLEYLLQRFTAKHTSTHASLRCLFLIRKFQEKSDDAWVFNTQEFVALSRAVLNAVEKCSLEIAVTVKPHPSNDYPATRQILDEIGARSWDVTYDPVYAASVKSDFAISVPSTSNLIPALLGIPVVLLNCSVKSAFDRWWGMRKLYPDHLEYYASSTGEILQKVAEAAKFASEHGGNCSVPLMPTRDVQHFRSEFPDGMLGSIEARLQELHAAHTSNNSRGA